MSLLQETPNKRSGVLFPIILGGFLALGNEAATKATINIASIDIYMRFLVYSLISTFVFKLIDKIRNQSILQFNFKIDSDNKIFSLVRSGVKKNELTSSTKLNKLSVDALKILLCWSPYILLLFPGVILWDTGDQIAQVFGISAFGQQPGQIFDHHPFFDAYVFGYTIKAIQYITGSFKLGVFVFVLLQCYLAAFVFSYGFAILKKNIVNERILKFSISFIKWFPLIPIMYCSMVKDVFHSIFFVWWIILFMQIIFSDYRVCSSPKFVSALLFSGLLVALTKKTGMYILIVSVIIFMFFKLKDRSKIVSKIIILLCVFVPFSVVSYVLPQYAYEPLNIVKGGSQASLAVPIEMLARTAKQFPDDITENEKEAINSYLLFSWEEIGKQYNPYIADPVTGFKVKDESKKSDFIKAWVSIGRRHPLTYLSAFVTIESGWITFNSVNYLNRDKESLPIQPQLMGVRTATHINPDTGGKLVSSDWNNPINQMVGDFFELLKSTPVINTPFYMAFWTLCFPMYILYYLWREGKQTMWFIATPYIISVLTLGLYSVSLSANDNTTRYMFHAVTLLPFVVCALDSLKRKLVEKSKRKYQQSVKAS